MPFQPGQSGNPGGRRKGPNLTDAIREQLTPEVRAKIASKILGLAEAGNLAAATFIADRIEGKPVQSLEHSGPEGKPILIRDTWDDDSNEA